MEKSLVIKYLFPLFIRWEDYEVFNDSQWEWDYIKWYNTEITEPTTEELETAWVTVEAELIEEQRQANITQEIADTIIEFTTIWGVTWKFRITDESFWPMLWQFLQIKEDSIEPINVKDCTYKIIPFTYQDFLDFKALVSDTQTAIIINNQ